MPSDLQVSNIKDLTGSNTGLSIASDGQVTIAQNNPTITLGSNATVNTQDYCVARLSSVQTLSDNAWATIALNSVSGLDPNGWFNDTSKKFTPTKAGKYFVTLMITTYANTGVNYNQISKGLVKKNNTDANDTGEEFSSVNDMRSGRGYNFTNTASGIVTMNGSSDYLYSVTFYRDYDNGNGKIDHIPSIFSAFRIGS